MQVGDGLVECRQRKRIKDSTANRKKERGENDKEKTEKLNNKR